MVMRKHILTVVMLALAVPAVAVMTANAEKPTKDKAAKTCQCPVAGKALKIGEEHASADYKEAKVYFCCEGCKGKFEADKAKYATKANIQLVATKQAKQVKCPLTGRPVNEEQTVSVGKVKVGLCCGGCKGKVNGAEEGDKAEMLFSDKAFEKGFEVVKK